MSSNQLGIVTGILLIYFVNAGIAGLHDEAWNITTGWRWMFGSGLVPSLVFIILLFSVPESPRWLAQRGQLEGALDILTKINGPTQARTELAGITNELPTESASSFSELVNTGLKKALLIGGTLAIFSQITGINAIMYYAPEIFKSTGDGSDSALLQTVLVGVVNLLFTFVAIKYVDQAGRKKLLLAGSAGMAICLVVGLVFILAYIACFALSLGPLTFVVIGEIFPNRVRGQAMSISIFLLWISVFLVSRFFPILLESIGSAFTFWLFMLLSIAAFVSVKSSVPETKGKALEEIDHLWLAD